MRIMARPAFKNRARNPYNDLLYTAIREAGAEVREYASWPLILSDWDILHIHWPESLLETKSWLHARWSEIKYLSLLDRARRKGTRIVWTVHDLKPHDLVFPELERRFWQAVLDRIDGVIGLTRTGLDLAHQRFPHLASRPSFVVPHGHYRDRYPNDIDKAEARRRLRVAGEATVITYFGQIRPYKNVPRLIASVRELEKPVTLFVCGRLSKRVDMTEELVQAAGGDPRIRLEIRFIADEDVQLYLNAADLLVFPYRDILNSGSALLGLSFDRPVLVPKLGALGELRDAVGADWVRTYDGDLDAAVLASALDWAGGSTRGSAPLAGFGWDAIARQTLAAFGEIARSPFSGRRIQAA
ncbi:MAG: glycosyltransferase [Rhodospirillales bacterium]